MRTMARATQKICLIFLLMSSILLGIGYSIGSPESHNLGQIIKPSNSDSWIRILKNGDRSSKLEIYNNSLYVIGYYTGHISKFDASGYLLWEYPLNIYRPSYVIDTNGSLLIVSESPSQNELSLVKLSSSGTLLYSKNVLLGSISYDSSLTLVENDSIILTAHSYQEEKLCIFKFNSIGDLLWNTSISARYFDIYPRIVSDSKHNFYIPHYNNDVYVAKVNSTGQLLWQIEFSYLNSISNLMIDDNDTLFLIGANYSDTSIFKINSSGSILTELVINDFSTSLGYNWLFDDMIIMTEYYPLALYCYDADLNHKWNYNLSDYVFPYYRQLVNLARDSQGNINILQSNRAADISLIKINSTGHHISQIIWGSSDAELLGSSLLDSDDNLFFLCHCVYYDRWRRRLEYTVLVKNPRNGGVPPVPVRTLEFKDYFLFSVLGVGSIISILSLITILRGRNKIASLKR